MNTTTSTSTLIRDDDMQQHIEDDLNVNAIRDGKLVEVYWNELTESEQQAARYNLFYNPYYY